MRANPPAIQNPDRAMAREDGPTRSMPRVRRTCNRATQTVLIIKVTATRDLGAEVYCAIHNGMASSMTTKCMDATPLSTVMTTNGRSRSTAIRGSPDSRAGAGAMCGRRPSQIEVTMQVAASRANTAR
jgi:hypothetical protein